MQDINSEKNTTTDDPQTGSIESPEKRSSENQSGDTIHWIAVFARLHSYLAGRTSPNDQEILRFCLRQLFYSMITLYQTALPDLAACTDAKTTRDLHYNYHAWTSLQEVQRVLERMESLCHLFIGTMNTLLDDLDRTSEPGSLLEDNEADEIEDTDTANTLVAFLEQWYKCNQQRLPFSVQFADLLSAVPALPQMDPACALILDSARTIFAVILPTFQVTPLCDDEVVLILLLDLLQKADLLLLQIAIFLPPLQALIKQFAL